jgi:hypothetical protein
LSCLSRSNKWLYGGGRYYTSSTSPDFSRFPPHAHFPSAQREIYYVRLAWQARSPDKSAIALRQHKNTIISAVSALMSPAWRLLGKYRECHRQEYRGGRNFILQLRNCVTLIVSIRSSWTLRIRMKTPRSATREYVQFS